MASRPYNPHFDKDYIPASKAGFIVYGDMKQGGKTLLPFSRNVRTSKERYVVGAWSEGRFADKHLAYQLPKGTIDGTDAELNNFIESMRQKYGPEDAQRVSDAINAADSRYKNGEKNGASREAIAGFIAAMRESYEETFVDIQSMLGPDNIAALFETGALENVPSQWHQAQDVTIKRISLMPVDDMRSLNRDGSLLRTQLFALQLADGDIEKLNRQTPLPDGTTTLVLKNQHTVNTKTGNTSIDPVASLRDGNYLPNDAQIIEWFTTGTMPDARWSENQDIDPEMHDAPKVTEADKRLIGNEDGAYFKALVEKHWDALEPIFFARAERGGDTTPEIKSFAELGLFYDHLGKNDPDAYKAVHAMAKQMKKTCEKLGILHGDLGAVKLDTHDVPGQIYAEGAQILPLNQLFRDSLLLGEKSHSYQNVMHGGVAKNAQGDFVYTVHDGEAFLPSESIYFQKLGRSQLGTLTAIARPQDVRLQGTNLNNEDDISSALERLRRGIRNEMAAAGNIHADDGVIRGNATERLLSSRDASGDIER